MNARERDEGEGFARRAEKLAAWYARQSARLGLSQEELTAAVKRGWTGNEIAEMPACDVEKLRAKPC